MIEDIFELVEIICKDDLEDYLKVYNLDKDVLTIDDYDIVTLATFNISIYDLYDIIKSLLPLCDVSKSELTNKWYRGFGKDNFWLIKQEIK